MRHVRRTLQLQEGKVTFLISQQNMSREFAPVLQDHANISGLSHNVIIRHHNAITRQNDSRAERILHPWPKLAKVFK